MSTTTTELPRTDIPGQIEAATARATRARALASEQWAAAELYRALAARSDAHAYTHLLRETLLETHEAAARHHALAADLHDEHVAHLVAMADRERGKAALSGAFASASAVLLDTG